MILWNSRGMTLIEMLVVAGLISFLAVTMGTMIATQQSALRNIEVKSNFMTMQRDLEVVMQSPEFCRDAFRQTAAQTLTYNPPANINTAYATNVPFVYSGTNNVVAALGVTASNPGVEVTSMTIRRQTGLQVTDTTYNHPTMGLINVRKHLAELQINARRVGGTLDKQEMTPYRSLVALYVNPTNNRVVSCQQNSKVQLIRAIATRSGLTAPGRSCMQNVDVSASPNLITGNPASCDTDGDGWCGTGTYTFAVAAHPSILDGTATVADWGLSPNSVIGAPGQEGRCAVSIDSPIPMPPDLNPANIFRIYNAPGPTSSNDGLGCNTAEGWYLSGCFSANNGLGDSDVSIRSDANAEYCVTNDITQPHYPRINLVWGLRTVGVTVICTRFQ